MRNANVVSVEIEAIETEVDAFSMAVEPEFFAMGRSLAYKLPMSPLELNLSEFAPTLETARLTKVKIGLENAVPESNFANFLVNGELIFGTTFDEESQTLEGFVYARPSGKGVVSIELADGTSHSFEYDFETD